MTVAIIVVAILILAFLAALAFRPVPILQAFARLWGQRVEWTDQMRADGYPELPAGVQVRTTRKYFRIFDVVAYLPRRVFGVPTDPTIGQTLGRIILVDPSEMTPSLIAHEFAHVPQWISRGWYALTREAEMEAEKAEYEFGQSLQAKRQT